MKYEIELLPLAVTVSLRQLWQEDGHGAPVSDRDCIHLVFLEFGLSSVSYLSLLTVPLARTEELFVSPRQWLDFGEGKVIHKYNFKVLLGPRDSKVCDKYMFLIYATTEVSAGRQQPTSLWLSLLLIYWCDK